MRGLKRGRKGEDKGERSGKDRERYILYIYDVSMYVNYNLYPSCDQMLMVVNLSLFVHLLWLFEAHLAHYYLVIKIMHSSGIMIQTPMLVVVLHRIGLPNDN